MRDSSSLRPILFLIYLGLLLLPLVGAGVPVTSGQIPFFYARSAQPGAWEFYQTDAIFKTTYTLSVARPGGPSQIINPPNANPNDLPPSVMICPGRLTMNATPASVWDVSVFDAHSAILPQANPPVPPGAWAPPGNQFPIQWSGPTIYPCSKANTQGELLPCMDSTNNHLSIWNLGEWSGVDTAGQKVNVIYRPNLFNAVPTYDCPTGNGNLSNKCQAEGGLVCNGTIHIGALTARLDGHPGPDASVSISFPTGGNYTVPAFLDVNTCEGVVHKLPELQNLQSSRKYYFYIDKLNNPLAVVKNQNATFKVQVVNPTTCAGTVSSANPSSLTLSGGQSGIVSITVTNPQVDTGITAVGVTTSAAALAAGWTVAPAPQPPANNFNVNIPATTSLPLRINVTAPAAGPVSGPVPIIILFNSSTPFCNNLVCNSTTQFNLTIVNQSVGCSITTNTTSSPANVLAPGEDLRMTAACTNAAGPTACPALTWTRFNCINLTSNAAATSPNISLDRFSNYNVVGKLAAPPFTPTTNTVAGNPVAVLETYNGAAPNIGTFTPTPESCDVAVNGTLNGTNFTCNLSSTAPLVNIVNKSCTCQLLQDTAPLPANLSVKPGEDLYLDTHCFCNGTQVTCPTLNWRHTFTNVSIEDVNLFTARGSAKAPPYTNPATTAPNIDPGVMLETYNGTPAGFFTPAPQTGDVLLNGSINGTPIACNASSTTNLSIVNCAIQINITLSAPIRFIGQLITVTARCYDPVPMLNRCPQLMWNSDYGGFIPGNGITAAANSPVTITLNVTNPAGTTLFADYFDPATGGACRNFGPANSTKSDLTPIIQFTPSTPQVGQKVTVTLITENTGQAATQNATTTLLSSDDGQFNNVPQPAPAGMMPGDNVTMTQTLSCNVLGFINVVAIADNYGKEHESNENNNVFNTSINCGGLLLCPDYV